MSSNISSSVPIGERVVIRMIEKEALTLVSEYPSTFQGFSILNLFPPENSEHLDNFVPCVHDMTISLTEAATLIDNVSDHKLHDSKVTINGVEYMPITIRLNSIYSASVKFTKNPTWAFFAKFDQFLLIVMVKRIEYIDQAIIRFESMLLKFKKRNESSLSSYGNYLP